MFEILFLFLFIKQSLLEIPMVKNMGRAVGRTPTVPAHRRGGRGSTERIPGQPGTQRNLISKTNTTVFLSMLATCAESILITRKLLLKA